MVFWRGKSKMEQEKMDLPRGVILVLVILSVIISILGSWTVMQESKRVQLMSGPQGTPVANGKVSVTVLPSNAGSSVSGNVVIRVTGGEK
jgi:hypothetical protein